MEPQEDKHFISGTIDQLGHCVKRIKRKSPPLPLLYHRKSRYKEGPGALTSTEEGAKEMGRTSVCASVLSFALWTF